LPSVTYNLHRSRSQVRASHPVGTIRHTRRALPKSAPRQPRPKATGGAGRGQRSLSGEVPLIRERHPRSPWPRRYSPDDIPPTLSRRVTILRPFTSGGAGLARVRRGRRPEPVETSSGLARLCGSPPCFDGPSGPTLIQ